jgi:bifunctional UDP-N-acetylglucosamine pyrophosphorylase/glucosamine-1-phosphate N-acetyltransferase
MKSDLPKALRKVCGRPMIGFVLDKAERLGAARIIVVVGWQSEKVIPLLAGRAEYVLQNPQLGTGHAMMCAEPKFAGSSGTVMLLYGDVPLLTEKTLRRLLDAHDSGMNKATVLTAVLDDPSGYGRIIRDPAGAVDRIVEHKDATEEERAVGEINTGIYCFGIPEIVAVLKEISNDNAQGEYYVTDAIGLMRRRGWRVGAVAADDPRETEGVNTEEQLARIGRIMCEISGDN